jgi:hypothetical protein
MGRSPCPSPVFSVFSGPSYLGKRRLAWRAEIKEASKQDSAISRTAPEKSLRREIVETHGGAAVYNKLSVGWVRVEEHQRTGKKRVFVSLPFRLGFPVPPTAVNQRVDHESGPERKRGEIPCGNFG